MKINFRNHIKDYFVSRFNIHDDSIYKYFEGDLSTWSNNKTKIKSVVVNGKTREIVIPNKLLLGFQKGANEFLQLHYEPRKCVHGYVPNKGILTNALEHKNSKIFLKMDIRKFFPSINIDILKVKLKELKIDDGSINMILKLVTREGKVYLGSAVSPIISNIFLDSFDKLIEEKCKLEWKGITYSRYADDLTFSHDEHSLIEISKIIPFVENELRKLKLNANSKKTTIIDVKKFNPRITGLVIKDGRVTLSKAKREKFFGYLLENKNARKISKIKKMAGIIAFVKMVDRDIIKRWLEIKELKLKKTIFKIENSNIFSEPIEQLD